MRYKKRCDNTKRNNLNKKWKDHLGFYVLFFFVFMFCGVMNLIGTNTYATDSISLSINNPNLEVNMMSGSSSGTFAESTASTISASTTSANGYKLNISSSGNTNLTNISDSTKTITSISSAISSNDFSTSSTYNNKWGYKPSSLYNDSTGQNISNTNFRPLPGENGEILAQTSSANATGTSDSYSLSFGARVNSSTAIGDYTNDTFVIAAVVNSNVLPCDSTKLCVEYDGNGLTYGGETLNRVNYNSTASQTTITKYSHTSNINDAGVQYGNYEGNIDTNDVITIPGASSLHVTITYLTESLTYDWAVIWAGNFPTLSARDDYKLGIVCDGTGPKLGGNMETTLECDILGDSVTIGFTSDRFGASDGYGYYASITGTGTTYSRVITSGEYGVPIGTDAVFHGWSSTQTASGEGLPSQVEYANESEVKSYMPGNNGDVATLYAVWQQEQAITFTYDNNVSSIELLNSRGDIVATITNSGQASMLLQGNTYIIRPNFNANYSTNNIAITTGVGSLRGRRFTVGAGNASISISSKLGLSQIQNYDCSTLINVGDTEEVYDNRDNETYLIGKLADGNCWLLDNLRLDLTNSNVLNGLSPTNTHADEASITSLKSGNRSAGSQYATAGFSGSNWTSSYSYSVPMINVSGSINSSSWTGSYTPNTIAPVAYGEGSGKIGAYYNLCAASAGSFCYGNGTSYTGSPSDDIDTSTLQDIKYDLCPAGWRLPTGTNEGEYGTLIKSYNNVSEGQNTAFRNALSIPLSGYISNGKVSSFGTYSYHYSSTFRFTYMEYALNLYSNTISSTGVLYRSEGSPIRCILMDTNTYNLNYDKNTTDIVSNMPSSHSDTLHEDGYYNFTLPTDASSIPTRSGWTFAGWSESSDDVIPDYKYVNGSFTPNSISLPLSDSPKTLYAVWWQGQKTTTIAFDSNVTSVDILDYNGDIVDTISTSGSSVSLVHPLTYAIKPAHSTGYYTDTVTITSGGGSINGKEFTAGTSNTTIYVTSKTTRTQIQNYNCHNLPSIGDTEEVYDNRDNETYLIGKLADGNCWLLDNLRLDLTDSTVLNSLNSLNTHANTDSLTSLKNGNRSAGEQYATAGVTEWTSFQSYSVPLVYSAYKDTVNSDSSKNYGNGSHKYGIYYNYCAASAGSFCYGNGDSSAGLPYRDPDPSTLMDVKNDLCPAGWRLPTGTDPMFGTGEHRILYDSYSDATEGQLTAYNNALSTAFAGYMMNNSTYISSQGSNVLYWSSTKITNDKVMVFFSPTNLSNFYGSASRGQSIRCISMETNTYTLNFDENTTDAVSNMPVMQSYESTGDDGYVFVIPTSILDVPARSGYEFAGWGESRDDVMPKYKYSHGVFVPNIITVRAEESPKTLYAIWRKSQGVTFTFDSNVSSVEILDEDYNIIDIVTTSGDSLSLDSPKTYIIKPLHTSGYSTNNITKTGGGLLSRKRLLVEEEGITIHITSKEMLPIQNYDCSGLAKYDTEAVYDSRDGEEYLVGRLEDDRCWLLDNLRLDLSNSAVLNNLNTSNTHADSASLTSLRSGNRSAGNQYASAGLTTNYYGNYGKGSLLAEGTANGETFNKDSVIYSHYGLGSGKVGIYYNYCAASAGSYCYGDTWTSSGGGVDIPNTLIDKQSDLCPAGWRMPTGSDSGEYKMLYDAYSRTENKNINFFNESSFVFSGYFNPQGGSSHEWRWGYYWTSTYRQGGEMYAIEVGDDHISPTNGYTRFYYLTMRCILMNDTVYTLNYDKNTADSVSNMPLTQTYESTRDDEGHTFTLSTNASDIPTRPGWIFAGWSESSEDTIPTYKYENGTFTPNTLILYPSTSPKTLYAVWYQAETINFTFDSGVTKIEVLDYNNNSMGTVSASGGTLNLLYPLTYTINVTHSTSYTTNAITKTTGAGTLNGNSFIVGIGNATINVSSSGPLAAIQNYNCSNLSVGATAKVYDTRDNEAYLIGRLADGNCWLLDNLRLDLSNSAVLNSLNTSNTHVDSTSLTSLKNGNRSAGNQYATAGFSDSNWTTNNVYSIPMIKTMGISNSNGKTFNKNTVVTSFGAGSGKVGIYYNFCAASAGSYCYGNGTSSSGTPSSDPDSSTLQDAKYDLCPAGWRLPTGSDSGEYKALYGSYSSASNQQDAFRTALSTPLSGILYSDNPANHEYNAYFWSSTWYAYYYIYALEVSNSSIAPSSQASPYYGLPIRCKRM